MRVSSWYRAGPAAALALGLVSVVAAGCGENAVTQMDGGGGNDGPSVVDGAGGGEDLAGGGGGNMAALSPATTSGSFSRPLDAVPESTGKTFYFTASSDSGPAVFTVPAAGGAATSLFAGAPLASPFGIAISSDDKTLFVADRSAGSDINDPLLDAPGGIYSLSTSGGMSPAVLTGTSGYGPCAVEANGADLYFTGRDKANGAPGLFKVGSGGGMPSSVASGAPFHSPCGIAVAKGGDVYVADSGAGQGAYGAIVKVSGGQSSVFVEGLPVGFPSGLALTLDESKLLLSGQDIQTGNSVVYVVDIASKAVSIFNKGIESSPDSSFPHKATELNEKSRIVNVWKSNIQNVHVCHIF